MGTISAEGAGGIGDKLEGKVAVITGDSGIGRAAAQRLVAGGAYVFIAGRRQCALEIDTRAQGMM